MEILVKSEDELAEVASKIAAVLSPGDLLLLDGEMGAGKTTFTRYLMQALAPDQSVSSPTFRLIHRYNTPKGSLYHLDLYRLNHSDDLYNLDIEPLIYSKKNMFVVEWASKFQDFWPQDAFRIIFHHVDTSHETHRKLECLSFPVQLF